MAALNVYRKDVITPAELEYPGFRHQRDLLEQRVPARLDVTTVEGREGLWRLKKPNERGDCLVESLPHKIYCEDEVLGEGFGSYLFTDACKNGHKLPPDGFYRGLGGFVSG